MKERKSEGWGKGRQCGREKVKGESLRKGLRGGSQEGTEGGRGGGKRFDWCRAAGQWWTHEAGLSAIAARMKRMPAA